MRTFSNLLADSADRYQQAKAIVDRTYTVQGTDKVQKIMQVISTIEQIKPVLESTSRLLKELYDSGCDRGSDRIVHAIEQIQAVTQVLEKAG